MSHLHHQLNANKDETIYQMQSDTKDKIDTNSKGTDKMAISKLPEPKRRMGLDHKCQLNFIQVMKMKYLCVVLCYFDFQLQEMENK